MLHAIDDKGNIRWYCRQPDCRYHSCQSWDDGIQCIAHPNRQSMAVEEVHAAHISDPGVQWTGPQVITLPVCPACGEKTALRVHDDEELTPPIITRDELTNEIIQVAPSPHPKYSPSLWQTQIEVTRKRIPHETLTHLSVDQIEELQAHNRNIAPHIPVEWMLTESTHVDIKSVKQHPAVDRHRSLAEQMQAIGKVYEPPKPTSAVETIEQVLTRLLQEHGLITSPRLPAMEPPHTNETN